MLKGMNHTDCIKGVVDSTKEFIKNILICVPKMNKALTGLERHEGE